mmetsp:Transcript_27418/g.53893  ORF Transcript_27418/g.53893 Transcript_27418/m.53893 type:complete len:280 (-) Transcript_27418:295-1134(-)
MDGENGQLKQFEEQTTFASYLEELIVLSKLASATSLVAQSNDLSKMHSMIHKGCKTQADLDSDVTEYVRKQFDSVVVKQVFASRPSPTIVTQLGKIFSAFAFRAFEFLNPKVVRAGHIKAGWGRLDGQVDWDIMIRRYNFQLNQDDAARLKEIVAPVLQKEIWTNSQRRCALEGVRRTEPPQDSCHQSFAGHCGPKPSWSPFNLDGVLAAATRPIDDQRNLHELPSWTVMGQLSGFLGRQVPPKWQVVGQCGTLGATQQGPTEIGGQFPGRFLSTMPHR